MEDPVVEQERPSPTAIPDNYFKSERGCVNNRNTPCTGFLGVEF